jgi:hypothetical protein
MDWLKALKEEKKNKRVESRPYQTNQTSDPNTFLWGTLYGTPPQNATPAPAPPLLDPEEGYPIPTDEAADERAAIIEFDGDGRDDLIQNVLRIFQGRYASAR